MRSYQVFAAMTSDEAVALLRKLSEQSAATFRQAVDAAAVASKMRPVYLRSRPFEQRAHVVRRTLARVSANPLAEEVLAVYFLECRKPLLAEWLDLLGLAHEDGVLESDDPAPPSDTDLRAAVEKFRSAGDEADRELLLRSFAAQGAIEWPALEAQLGFAD